MSFGSKLLELRKKKGLSQEQLADLLGSKAPVIGRYERNEAKPSIDTAKRIADILEISLDYLTGISDIELDTNVLNTVLNIQKLPKDDKIHIMKTVDALLRDAKARKTYAI